MGRLSGKKALITGATSGIGENIARLFAAEGASVVICARRQELGQAIVDSIKADGGSAFFWPCDASDEGSVRVAMQGVKEDLGGLDILVNNAGIAPAGPLEEMELEEWNRTLGSNITSVFLVTKHALPLLAKGNGANIINLGSTFGVVGAAGSTAYAMTKAAVMGMTKSMALEFASRGIRVNALCPGATETPFLLDWAEETGDAAGTMSWLLEHHPIGRIGTTDDQAKAALFLASDDASFVTGHSLLVDGGYTAQ
jgi:NAD(P)-dependent dehydrogenase (short-subunit alcohol dehydrogenase family)